MTKKVVHIEEVTKRLRILRGGRSQADVAKAWGITQQHVDKYESGTIPGGAILRRIAGTEGISLNWLLLGEGPIYRRGSRTVELRSQDLEKQAPSEDNLFRVADAPEIQYDAEVGYEVWMVRELWQRGIKTPEQLNALLEAYDALAKAVNKKEDP